VWLVELSFPSIPLHILSNGSRNESILPYL
jgi:hypothetical protein